MQKDSITEINYVALYGVEDSHLTQPNTFIIKIENTK